MAYTKASTSLLISIAVIITIFSTSIPAANALRCHQCNSHLQEDCTVLRLVTPRAPRDDQFLGECESPDMFCRKIVTQIEVTGEHRIIRSCGKLDNKKEKNSYCFDADNEGFKQTICNCFEDGCNAAPPRLGNANHVTMLSATGLCVLVARFLRISA
ncbi:uncharacterized protein LOC101460978 [Ceratitis capitata]|uniref:uncharacterized protein LOC101460978 n=1 Tax=Ceratitis capitata TaxID=7213 RepID=UPI0003296FF5|nr:uncharacterized protein LOC101460978 [Ceratitis capitata]